MFLFSLLKIGFLGPPGSQGFAGSNRVPPRRAAGKDCFAKQSTDKSPQFQK